MRIVHPHLGPACQPAKLSRVLGPLKVKGGTAQRQVFTDAFGEIVRELGLGTYHRPGDR
jgi:hypothetical protein